MAAPARRRSTSARLLVALLGATTVALQVVSVVPAGAAGEVITVDNPSIGEPGDVGVSNELVFTITRTAGPAATVDYQTADVTATAGADYLGTDGTLAFGANETQKQLRIGVLGDNLDEGDETFTLLLSGASDGSPDVNATGTIVDDSDPVPSLSVSNTAVGEGNAGTIGAGFIVSLSNPSGRTVSVRYAASDGTATVAGGDYAATSGTLSIPAGRLSAVVSVPVTGDTISEDDETFTLTLADPVNATLSAAAGTGTIIDDDNLPSLSVNDAVTPDEKTAARFTVTLSAPSGRPVEVDVTAAGGALPSATPGVDFNQPVPRHLIFAAGVTSIAVDVPIVDDAADEPAEHFTLTLSNPSRATLARAVGAGTITDDDPGPSLSIGDVSKPEGTGLPTPFTFPVTLSGADTTKTVTVAYDVNPGTATTPSDYTVPSLAGTLTFLPGVTSRDLTVSVNADSLAEAAETFTVVLRDPSAGVTLAKAQATGTIQNDDGPPANISVNDVTVAEGAAGQFTVTLQRPVPDVVSVSWTLKDGSAVAGPDYAAAAGIVTFAPNSPGPATISFTVHQDTLHEADETFTVELSNPINAVLLKGTGTATITDDDALPVVSIQPSRAVAEGDEGNITRATLDVTLSAASGLPASVGFSSADGSATSGADYTVDANATLTFAPGETKKRIALSATGDTLFEGDESFTVTLASPAGASLGGSVSTVSITDNDPMPVVHIEAPATAVLEPATPGEEAPASFAVKLDRVSGKAVTVKAATANGTASSGSDYVAVANQTVTIPAGAVVGTAVVRVRGDNAANEPDETFTVTISTPVSATIQADRATATGVIRDNTASSTPRVTVLTPAVTVKEGNSGTSPATVSLSLTPAQATAVAVSYSSADGTATAPADYPAVSGATVTFAPGETAKTVSVAVGGDSLDEADETFTVQFQGAQVTSGQQDSATVTIRDDDGPAVSVDPTSVVEGDSGTRPAVFTVSLSGASPQAVTVGYGTSDGTATSPSDYTPTSGTVTFNPGERTKTVSVAVVGDTSDEPDEDFSVRLSSPTNATLEPGAGLGDHPRRRPAHRRGGGQPPRPRAGADGPGGRRRPDAADLHAQPERRHHPGVGLRLRRGRRHRPGRRRLPAGLRPAHVRSRRDHEDGGRPGGRRRPQGSRRDLHVAPLEPRQRHPLR